MQQKGYNVKKKQFDIIGTMYVIIKHYIKQYII